MIIAGYTGSKNSVRNRLKIQIFELDFSKLNFQKSSMYRSTGGKESKDKVDIQHIHLGDGFEFGPQMIRDLTFVCL